MSDAWDDEGFGAEDDWEGTGSVGSDLEDTALSGFGDELDEAELDDEALLGDEDE